MNQFDSTINGIIDSVIKDTHSINNALLSEALISVQKAIKQSEEIKVAIANRVITDKAGKLLLLCADLEKVNSLLLQIKREYSL